MKRPMRAGMRVGLRLCGGWTGRLLPLRGRRARIVGRLRRKPQRRLKLSDPRRQLRVLLHQRLDPRHQRGDQSILVRRVRWKRHAQVDSYPGAPRNPEINASPRALSPSRNHLSNHVGTAHNAFVMHGLRPSRRSDSSTDISIRTCLSSRLHGHSWFSIGSGSVFELCHIERWSIVSDSQEALFAVKSRHALRETPANRIAKVLLEKWVRLLGRRRPQNHCSGDHQPRPYSAVPAHRGQCSQSSLRGEVV